MSDLIGKRFGKWKVIGKGKDLVYFPPSRPDGQRVSTWLCECECGTIREISNRKIKKAKQCFKCNSPKQTHGMSKTPEFKCWDSMKQRCLNRNSQHYKDYGGRGISVCKKWAESFKDFLSDVGLRPEGGMLLDRIDNNGNYEPGNVRWASAKVSSRNHRANRKITLNGVTATIAEWSEKIGISQKTIGSRLLRGWSVEDALSLTKKYDLENSNATAS